MTEMKETPPLETLKSEKEKQWEALREKVEGIRDGLDMPVDEGIKESVIALLAHEFPTSQSCEGHLDRGGRAPWVQIKARGEPGQRFVGQHEIMKEVAEKYGLQFEDIKDGISEERPHYAKQKKAWHEAHTIYSKNTETPEYITWRKKNDILRERAEDLLKEFYEVRKVPDDVKLTIEEGAEGTFRIHNGGDDYLLYREKLTKEQKKQIPLNLPKYQQEMRDFTEFLKRKFFGR